MSGVNEFFSSRLDYGMLGKDEDGRIAARAGDV